MKPKNFPMRRFARQTRALVRKMNTLDPAVMKALGIALTWEQRRIAHVPLIGSIHDIRIRYGARRRDPTQHGWPLPGCFPLTKGHKP